MAVIDDMADILISDLKRRGEPYVDLNDDDSLYVKFYFDYLSNDSVFKVMNLFPEGRRLYEKYKKIKTNSKVTDTQLCEIVDAYLKSSRGLMSAEEYLDAATFIDSLESVQIAESVPKLESNQLDLFAYGVVGNWLIDNMPEEQECWILFHWAIEFTKYYTVAAYLLEDYLDIERGVFEPAFQLWNSGNASNYWAETNSLASKTVFCKSLGWGGPTSR